MLRRQIALVGAPSSAGAYGVGPEQAPGYLRAHGMTDEMRARGLDVEDVGDLPMAVFSPDPGTPNAQNLGLVVEVAGNVARVVEDLLQRQRFVLVIGGDCTITIGVMAAFVSAFSDPGLLYLDGDIDLSTPDHTRSGILDAMVLAHLLGETSNALSGVGGRQPLLTGSQVAALGFDEDDIGEREEAILAGRAVSRLSAQQVAGEVAGRASHLASDLASRSDALCVHFDVDVIDSIELPLAKYPHFNQGMSLDGARQALSAFCRQPLCRALVLTEVTPSHDPDGRYANALIEVIVDALAGEP